MNNHDPREALIQKGHELLDLIYQTSQFEEKYADLLDLVKHGGEGMGLGEKMDVMMRPDFITAITESLKLHAQHEKTLAAYVPLRRTIEALDVSRPTLADFDN